MWAAACAVLALLCLILLLRLILFRRAAAEITQGLSLRLETETNTLLTISSRDKRLRELASALNVQLRALRQARQRYEQGDTALKEAVINISHDLRTPLTAILGYLDLLEREALSPEMRRYTALIYGRTQALCQLTDELLRYTVDAGRGGETRTLVRLDLTAALEEALASFYGALSRRGIVPEISLPAGKVERELDAAALSRIFNNILNNALKYSDGDLAVTLDEGGTIIFSNSAGTMDAISTGRLFDRFYTVDSGRTSTGLGLAIARQLTEQLGGHISADYAGGRLSITLCFPEKPSEVR